MDEPKKKAFNQNTFNIIGLTSKQVDEAKIKFGNNKIEIKKENEIYNLIISIVKDPMVILLLVTSIIYFINGKIGDGIFLSTAIILVSALSSFQNSRSRKALKKLEAFALPVCKVIREGKIEEIKSEDLTIGDSVMVGEGDSIPADCVIIHSNDFSVNDSILSGESLPIYIDINSANRNIYSGTTVTSGLAISTVIAIGAETKIGKIGKSLDDIIEEKTPLELKINNFVKVMLIVGGIILSIVWVINFFRTYDVLDSLVKSLTLAMSIMPEEIPVAFTSYMALGAWRLLKIGIVVKQTKTVETLGSATVICTDKTGTITENKMSLIKIYSLKSNNITNIESELNDNNKELISLAMWASEPIPFDPMENAIHEIYSKIITEDERLNYKIVREYPLAGKPPMMTHIFKNNKKHSIIAAKGAPEALMAVSILNNEEKVLVEEAVKNLTDFGYRVLAVGEGKISGEQYPEKQDQIQFNFKGILAFYDPPKKNIKTVLESFYKAGIDVKIITGDNIATTQAIAKQVGFRGFDKAINGDELMNLSNDELQKCVKDYNIFTRMFPDAKIRIINALKLNNEIVAMTGDGVNDGPALKAAHIGIAMGKRGSETAKQAASLILMEDDLSKMIDAIAMGRKIYANLKKAIQFIISIHIPIILTVLLPLALNWVFPFIFSAVHIIFLELIMGPTCSIIYENEPLESDAMEKKPKQFTLSFLNLKDILTSILQGVFITIGALLIYQYSANNGNNEAITRTMVFSVLISSNIFLTLVNRSFYYSIFTTIKYKNNFVLLIIASSAILLLIMIYLQPITSFFKFEHLTLFQFLISVVCGFIFVIWYEIIKYWKRIKNNKAK